MLILPWGANILANKVSQIFNSDPVAQKKNVFFLEAAKRNGSSCFYVTSWLWNSCSVYVNLCIGSISSWWWKCNRCMRFCHKKHRGLLVCAHMQLQPPVIDQSSAPSCRRSNQWLTDFLISESEASLATGKAFCPWCYSEATVLNTWK